MVVEVFLFNCHYRLLHISVHPSLLLFQDLHCRPAVIYLVFWVHVYSDVPLIYDDRYMLCACGFSLFSIHSFHPQVAWDLLPAFFSCGRSTPL